jgi:DNA-binding Xre family transcriptional regulator
MAKIAHPKSETLTALLEQIIQRASERHISEKELALRAGIQPETLSRMKSRGTGDFGVVDRMARVVGWRLSLAPDHEALKKLQEGSFF